MERPQPETEKAGPEQSEAPRHVRGCNRCGATLRPFEVHIDPMKCLANLQIAVRAGAQQIQQKNSRIQVLQALIWCLVDRINGAARVTGEDIAKASTQGLLGIEPIEDGAGGLQIIARKSERASS